MRNYDVLRRVDEEITILDTAESKRKANWIGHILSRDCLLNGVIKGEIGGLKGMGMGQISITEERVPGRVERMAWDIIDIGIGALRNRELAGSNKFIQLFLFIFLFPNVIEYYIFFPAFLCLVVENFSNFIKVYFMKCTIIALKIFLMLKRNYYKKACDG